jgi:hypothetical protein
MDAVVDLLQWRRARRLEPLGQVERLERAVARLDAVASESLERSGELEPWVETELLAIMGALSMDLFDEAAARAERVADRLAGRRRRPATR